MWKKFAVITGLSVAALGIGGAAWAGSGAGTSPPPSPTTVSSAPAKVVAAKHRGEHERLQILRHVTHAQWVSREGKTGTFVTYDAIRGRVSAVSATSISVKAADGVSETYAVTASTKVHAKGDNKSHPGTIGQVKVGDTVGVLGTGAGNLTATHVIDRGVPKPASSSSAPTTG